jgi:hypothetical protein
MWKLASSQSQPNYPWTAGALSLHIQETVNLKRQSIQPVRLGNSSIFL